MIYDVNIWGRGGVYFKYIKEKITLTLNPTNQSLSVESLVKSKW